jgi:hypothetical protein
VLISTWWVPSFHIALLAGPPWLIFITLCYLAWRRANPVPPTGASDPGVR